MKGKAKTKAKAKGKGKAKGKRKVMKAVRDAEGQGQDGDVAMVARKSKAPSLKAQVLKLLEEKSFDEAMAERKKIGAKLDEQIGQRSKVDAAASKKVDEAQRHFAEVQAEVASAEEQELEAMNDYKAYAAKRGDASKAKESANNELLEATRSLAIIEVMAENRKKMQELEEKRHAAQEAAQAATQHLAAQKAAEKEALEATRKALMEQKAKALADKEALKPKGPAPGTEEEETQVVGAVRKSDDLD